MKTANIMPESIPQNFIKVFTFSILASAVTFGLFVLMDTLTRIDETTKAEQATYIPIVAVMEESRLEEPRETLPAPPELLIPPERTRVEPVQNTEVPGVGTNYNPAIPKSDFGTETLQSFMPSDNNAMPIVRVEPKYPVEAAREGIEGWVKLSFDINSLGQVENVRVLDAEPTRIFEREAKRALLRWKYKAKVIEGKAIRQSGQVVMLSFNLDS